jgi:short-subunit dehydrogenase
MNEQNALVTGASEGLGKSFALELARRNCNLVLVSLPKSGLPELASFIRKNFTVAVAFYEMDLTQPQNCETVFRHLKDQCRPVDILINNAGLGNTSWFEEHGTGFYKKQIELNTITPVVLTRLFLEQVDNRRKNFILNVGSLGGLFVVPKKSVYGATKSFIRYFTKCLQLESAQSNVSITLLSPGGINTKPDLLHLNNSLKGIAKATVLEAEDVARIAINGMLHGKREIVPGTINKLFVLLDGLLPFSIKRTIINRGVETSFR